MVENLAGVFVVDHLAGVDLVDRSAFVVVEGMGHDSVESSDQEDQSTLEEAAHKAYLEILDLAESHVVEDHSRDHIEDSNFGIVVVFDVEGVVGSLEVEMEADF